jgi:hypothetical protein
VAALEEALFDYLSTALASEVGTRIFPTRSPEGTQLPYVTYQRVSASRIYTHDPFPDDLAWVRARISIACVATTALGSIDVADAVISALSGYDGDMEGLSLGKVDVINEIDAYDPQTKLYRRVVDVFVDYEEVPLAS